MAHGLARNVAEHGSVTRGTASEDCGAAGRLVRRRARGRLGCDMASGCGPLSCGRGAAYPLRARILNYYFYLAEGAAGWLAVWTAMWRSMGVWPAARRVQTAVPLGGWCDVAHADGLAAMWPGGAVREAAD